MKTRRRSLGWIALVTLLIIGTPVGAVEEAGEMAGSPWGWALQWVEALVDLAMETGVDAFESEPVDPGSAEETTKSETDGAGVPDHQDELAGEYVPVG